MNAVEGSKDSEDVKDNVLAGVLVGRNARGAAESIPSEQTDHASENVI